MNVTVKPVPVGDMAGALAYFVTDDGDLTYEQVLETIRDNTLPHPRLVIFDGRSMASDIITVLAKDLHGTHTTVLVTAIDAVTPVWYAVNRVVLVGAVFDYTGLPANEVHLHWTTDDEEYPVVSPIAANNVHVYCTTQKGHFSDLIEWARRAPYAIGIISRTL